MKKNKSIKKSNFFRNLFFLGLAIFNGLFYASSDNIISHISLVILFLLFVFILITLRDKIKIINYVSFVSLIIGSKYKIEFIFNNFFIISSFIFILYNQIYKKIKSNKSKESNEATLQDIDNFKNAKTTKEQSDQFEGLIRDSLQKWPSVKTSYTTGDLRKANMLPPMVTSTGGSGEQGMDNVCFFKKPMVINNIKYDGLAIQAKHYQDTVTNKAIQEIHSATEVYSKFYRKKLYPIALSNSTFSKDAILLAKDLRIKVVDRSNLIAFLKGKEPLN